MAGVGLSITSGELAALVGGELRGAPDVRLDGLAPLEHAGPSDLSFMRDGRFAGMLGRSRAGAVLVTKSILGEERGGDAVSHFGGAVLVVEDADMAMLRLLEAASSRLPTWVPRVGISPTAVVDSTVEVGRDVRVGDRVVVGPGCRVGDGVVLQPGVVVGGGVAIGEGSVLGANSVVLDRCQVGRGVILHPGVVIGADGFGYRPGEHGPVKIPHIGTVVLEDGVEVGANSTIDRGKFGATRIGANTKIDNQCQIGHNCNVGRGCLICGCSGLAGSVVIEDGVTLGGFVGVADALRVGAGARIGAKSGVMGDVPPGETWIGFPARPAREWMRGMALLMSWARKRGRGDDPRGAASWRR